MSCLVIKTNMLLKEKELDSYYHAFVNMKAMGVVILPAGFEALYVPDDVEVKMEAENKEDEWHYFIDKKPTEFGIYEFCSYLASDSYRGTYYPNSELVRDEEGTLRTPTRWRKLKEEKN